MNADELLPLADILPDPLLLLSPAGILCAANRAAARALSLRADHLSARSLSELAAEPETKVTEFLRLCRRSQNVVLGALTIGGTRYRCEGALVRSHEDGAGALIALRLVSRDAAVGRFVLLNEQIEQLNREIARRQRTERELAEERQWLRITLLSIGDAVITTDAHGRIRLLNPVAEALTGWTRDEAFGRPLEEVFRIVNEETRRTVENPVSHVLRDGRIVGLANHTLLIHRNGSERPIDDSAAPICSEDGRIGGVVMVFRDVTERRHAERELYALNQSLERRIEERTALAEQRAGQLRALAVELTRVEQLERRRLAVILHDDLQQLIVAAKMHLTAMMGSGAEARRAHADAIHEMLGQAIDTSRTLAVELAPPVLYDAGLGAALQWLGRWVGVHLGLEVEVKLETKDAPADVQVSAFLLQAVRELLLNVVKHGGVQSARVRMSAPQPGEIELEVEDEGAGFDMSDADKQARGTGFGLLSIRERLEMLGGRLVIESALGRGTRVRLTCPTGLPARVEGTADRISRSADTKAPQWGRIRVLLVDDHRVLRQGLAALLAACPDIEVVGETGDGEQAIAEAERLRPDVVIMDVAMPGLGGVEATRRLLSRLPEVRVIGLSLHEEADMSRSMLDAGAVCYLMKDGPSDDVIAAIRSAASQ